jgi:hypothetical protein
VLAAAEHFVEDRFAGRMIPQYGDALRGATRAKCSAVQSVEHRKLNMPERINGCHP